MSRSRPFVLSMSRKCFEATSKVKSARGKGCGGCPLLQVSHWKRESVGCRMSRERTTMGPKLP